MKPQILKIIVVEKDKSQHDSYHDYFKNFPNYDLVGIYSSANDALRAYKKNTPDIIILDVNSEGLKGLESIKLFRRKDWNVKIIM
ncbi:MAG: response regulator, partial [Maribacter sp.]